MPTGRLEVSLEGTRTGDHRFGDVAGIYDGTESEHGTFRNHQLLTKEIVEHCFGGT